MKIKGERERYTQLNAEFQEIARRAKKAFFNEQCKEVEENNRVGKTRDLFQENWSYQGNISCQMGMIKDRNGMDLTEAEEIKKMWQNYPDELQKEVLMTGITMIV